jgi:hypothetical protein
MFPEAFSRVSLCILLRESSAEILPKNHPIEVTKQLESTSPTDGFASKQTSVARAGWHRLPRLAEFCLRPFLSDHLRQTARMKLILRNWFKTSDHKTLAKFGEARLIQKPTGKIELIGGTAADRIAAKEWVSLFLHEATV